MPEEIQFLMDLEARLGIKITYDKHSIDDLVKEIKAQLGGGR